MIWKLPYAAGYVHVGGKKPTVVTMGTPVLSLPLTTARPEATVTIRGEGLIVYNLSWTLGGERAAV